MRTPRSLVVGGASKSLCWNHTDTISFPQAGGNLLGPEEFRGILYLRDKDNNRR